MIAIVPMTQAGKYPAYLCRSRRSEPRELHRVLAPYDGASSLTARSQLRAAVRTRFGQAQFIDKGS